jgi:hypothetical protein
MRVLNQEFLFNHCESITMEEFRAAGRAGRALGPIGGGRSRGDANSTDTQVNRGSTFALGRSTIGRTGRSLGPIGKGDRSLSLYLFSFLPLSFSQSLSFSFCVSVVFSASLFLSLSLAPSAWDDRRRRSRD